MALAMLRKAAASGTRAIFATSHVLSAGEHPSWEKLQAGVEWLRGACRDNDIDLQIYSGAEVFMDWELLDELAVNGSYCLNGEAFGKQAVTYMLVELPMHFLPQYADDFWYELRLKGVVPILAHPERYPELMAKTERLLDFVTILQEELLRAGVLPADYDFEAHKKLVPMQPGDVPVTYADTTPLERDFGFKPSTPLREGLRKFAEWYKEFYHC